MTKKICPVVLCGGSGTRLWPLSRKSFPKQFSSLTGERSLFQKSVLRTLTDAYSAPLVLTSNDFRFIVQEQLEEIGVTDATIVIEPEAKNTAPAVLAAALILGKKDPDSLLLLLPSDHEIPDSHAFNIAVASGTSAASSGEIITFGIKPSRAETGYGWLELGEQSEHGHLKLKAFKEKPNKNTAEQMLEDGGFLWNAGIFLFSSKSILKAFEQFEPTMLKNVTESVALTTRDLTFQRLGVEAWSAVESNSIDYAVMERSPNLSVVRFESEWSDLGGWDAVLRYSENDAHGVALSGNATSIDCKNSLIRSENEALEVVGIGLENIVVVAMADAVLVADTSKSQDVKLAVNALKEKGAKQAESFPRDIRPWGWFETIALSDRYQVKKIVVKPGGILSLQSHVHRSEHWIVVSGTARVTIDEDVKLVTENQSVYIPLGAVHRMENPGKLPMILIEVQTGIYLGEDDIVRYEDLYARS